MVYTRMVFRARPLRVARQTVKSLHVQLSIRHDESRSKMLETELFECDAVAFDSDRFEQRPGGAC